jgi:hypothetical protein
MQKPSPYWQNIMFSEYEELKVVVMVTIILRIVLKLKNPPKISLL